MGGVAKSVKSAFSSPTRVVTGLGTGGLSELYRASVPGASQGLDYAGNKIDNAFGWGSGGGVSTSGNDAFSISPEELAANSKAINDLGQSQYDEYTKALTGDQSDSLKNLLTQQAADSFKRTLPQTAEDFNAGHLLNSTGYQQEVGRQQANLAGDIANQLAQKRIEALTQKQSAAQSALSRQFSLQDFIRQANVAKAIGAQTAPQVNNGKAGTGSLLSGIGSLAPLAGALIGGPAGAAVGSGIGTASRPVATVGGRPVYRNQTFDATSNNYGGGLF